MHREQGCIEKGVPDTVDQRATADAHLTDEQLIGWTNFEMRPLVGEMTCQRTDASSSITITHRVAVLDLVNSSTP